MTGAHAAPQADAIRQSADYILSCQLPNGLIAMNRDEKHWAVPYSANFTCIGLLRAYQATRHELYLDAVRRYVAWFERHINPDGTIYDFKGARSRPEPTGNYDSSDSYPATFIVLCWETHAIMRDAAWLRARYPALLKCLDGIRLTWQADGLTWAKPNYKAKFLMDNIEVRASLRAAVRIGESLGDRARVAAWRQMLEENRRGLGLMWAGEQGAFHYAVFSDNKRRDVFERWYPQGMANAFALAYLLDPRDSRAKALAGELARRFADTGDYWLFAALRKFGFANAAAAIRERAARRLTYTSDHGLYLRMLTPEFERFCYEEELRLPL